VISIRALRGDSALDLMKTEPSPKCRPLCALQKRIPILRLRPRLEVVEGDVGKFTVERGAIHRKTDAVEPFVHPGGILAHALADDIGRDR
jgi:hypothetical protein